MKVSFIGNSIRENEKRLPIHPAHLGEIKQECRSIINLDEGYGKSFGVTDFQLRALGYRVSPRAELLETSDIIVIPKPMEPDLKNIKEGALIWGWLHFVLYGDLADICIRKKHTVVTWEGMFDERKSRESRPRHIFSGNNELAGYAGTIHALGLMGLDGIYGPSRNVAVLGYGYAGRASVRALIARGFENIVVYTQRASEDVLDKIKKVTYKTIVRNEIYGSVIGDEAGSPLCEALATADIIVNCGGQDPEDPFMYVLPEYIEVFDHECLVIDISCDPGMGFPFIRTTTFEDPIYSVGRVKVCAVDHTPGFLWDASTWQISKEVLKFIPDIISGKNVVQNNPILAQAMEIEDGLVVNKKILSYQKRCNTYPFERSSL